MNTNNLIIEKLNDKVINIILTITTIFTSLAVVGTYFRDSPDKFDFSFLVLCFVLIVISIVAVFRKKIKLNIKVYIIIACILVGIINAFSNLGFLASAKFYIIMTPVLLSFVMSFKKSFALLTLFVLVYSIFGYLYVNKIVKIEIDANSYIINDKTWIVDAIVLFSVSFCLIYVGSKYLKEVLRNLLIINKQNKKLSQNEVELLRHRDNLEILVKQKTEDLEIAIEELKSTNNELSDKNEIIQKQTELLTKKNKEKTIMMKEIHHRVKNNLQVVNSLLHLQSSEFKDAKIVAKFEEAQNRVVSMALIHEKMYRSDDMGHTNIKEYLTLLIEDLVHNYSIKKDITLDLEIKEITIGIKTLMPLGLIINEIISNSLKHAFNNQNEGIIKVSLEMTENEQFELIIGDNGVGMKESTDGTESSTLGSELIEMFTEQLEGKLVLIDGPGTTFKITFKNIDTI